MVRTLDKVRLVVARLDDEKYPTVVGAWPESMWEIVPEEDWLKMRHGWLEQALGPDWPAYEVIEVIAEIPSENLLAQFATRKVSPLSLVRADD